MASAALIEFIENTACNRPYCANVKNAAMIRPKKIALGLPYIQLNPPTHHSVLIFDVDRRGAAVAWEDTSLPPPTYVATNPENGHAHIGYALASPVCKTQAARLKPLRYLAAIEHEYTTRLGADFGYCGPLSKNPLHPSWRLWEPANLPIYELDFLAEYVDLPKILPARPSGVGRNCDLFEALRLSAYRAVRDFWGPGRDGPWFEAVLRQAITLNKFDNPLPMSEVRCLARSVARYVWRKFSPAEFRALQVERGRRGGIASGEMRRALSADKRQDAYVLFCEGLSQRAIAAKLDVGQATVARWLSERHFKSDPEIDIR